MEIIRIVWDIHYRCNYRCPYCWFEGSAVRELKKVYISADEWIRRWDYLYRRYGAVHIEITGGEPFIYPYFQELIKGISIMHTIRITTNLSANIANFLSQINPERVKVISSFHPSFTELETFLEKVLLLKERGFGDTVIYVAYPPQLKQIKYFDEIFRQKGIVFSVTPFWGKYKEQNYPDNYSQEEREILIPYLGDDIKRVEFTLAKKSPKGKLCRAGQQFALLGDDGMVFRCGQLKNKVIGNIFDENFSFLDMPTPCEADSCPCDDHNYLVGEL